MVYTCNIQAIKGECNPVPSLPGMVIVRHIPQSLYHNVQLISGAVLLHKKTGRGDVDVLFPVNSVNDLRGGNSSNSLLTLVLRCSKQLPFHSDLLLKQMLLW